MKVDAACMLRWHADVAVQNQVNQVVIPDYGNWVSHGDEMWLDHIKQRIARREYASRAAFLGDFERLAANARAYNGPGHGELGDQGDYSTAACLKHAARWFSVEERAAWHVPE